MVIEDYASIERFNQFIYDRYRDLGIRFESNNFDLIGDENEEDMRVLDSLYKLTIRYQLRRIRRKLKKRISIALQHYINHCSKIDKRDSNKILSYIFKIFS